MIRSTQPELLLGSLDSLGDPIRLRLLRILEQHELGVAELCEVLQLPQSTVSRHLKVLSDKGWLRSQRRRTVHLYRMPNGELNVSARKLWGVAREQTNAWPAAKQDQLRLARRLQQRREQSDAFFAGAAGRWDKLRDEWYGKAFAGQAVLALLAEDATVADLGCGTGPVTARLAPWVGKVIGVDASAAMLKAASRRTAELQNVELRRGDLTSIPIDDSSCDAAMLLLVLSYVAEPAAVLREMSRILKPGGRAVIVDLLPHDRDDFRQKMGQQVLGFALDEVRAMTEEAGMSTTRSMPLPSEAEAKGPALFLVSVKRKQIN